MKSFDRQVATDALEALGRERPGTFRLDPQADVRLRRPDARSMVRTIGIILREVDFGTLAVAMKDCNARS